MPARRGRWYKKDDDRITNHGQMRPISRHIERILPRGVHNNIVRGPEAYDIRKTNEENHTRSCQAMKER